MSKIEDVETEDQMAKVIREFLPTLGKGAVGALGCTAEEAGENILARFAAWCFKPEPAIVLPVKALKGTEGRWFVSDTNDKYITDVADEAVAERMVELMNRVGPGEPDDTF